MAGTVLHTQTTYLRAPPGWLLDWRCNRRADTQIAPALGDGLGELEGDGLAVAEWLGLGLCEGLGVCDGLALAEWLGLGLCDGLALAE